MNVPPPLPPKVVPTPPPLPIKPRTTTPPAVVGPSPWPMRLIVAGGFAAVCLVAAGVIGVTLPTPAVTQAAPQPIVPTVDPFADPPPAPLLPAHTLPPEVKLERADGTVAPKPPPAPVVHYGLQKSPMLGSVTGGWPFQKLGLKGEPAIGFRVEMADWDWPRRSIVRTLEPVFASDNVIPTATMVMAKQGYAAGAFILDGDQDVQAIRIVFMRQTAAGLDPNDSYQTDWYGKPKPGRTLHVLRSKGDPIAGTYGRHGMNMDALGVIFRHEVAN